MWILIAVFAFFWGSTVLGVALQLADRGVGAWWMVLAFGMLPIVVAAVVASRGQLRRREAPRDSESTSPAGDRVVVSAEPAEDLTAREREVLELLAAGRTNRQIAEELYVSIATVKSHVNAICRKLTAENRTHAVAIARERGLLN
jgi:DNA-binding NarL/FixJ family response regulator